MNLSKLLKSGLNHESNLDLGFCPASSLFSVGYLDISLYQLSLLTACWASSSSYGDIPYLFSVGVVSAADLCRCPRRGHLLRRTTFVMATTRGE